MKLVSILILSALIATGMAGCYGDPGTNTGGFGDLDLNLEVDGDGEEGDEEEAEEVEGEA